MRSITLLLYKPMEGCFEEVSLRLKKIFVWTKLRLGISFETLRYVIFQMEALSLKT